MLFHGADNAKELLVQNLLFISHWSPDQRNNSNKENFESGVWLVSCERVPEGRMHIKKAVTDSKCFWVCIHFSWRKWQKVCKTKQPISLILFLCVVSVGLNAIKSASEALLNAFSLYLRNGKLPVLSSLIPVTCHIWSFEDGKYLSNPQCLDLLPKSPIILLNY